MSKTLFKVSYRNCKISSAKDQQRRAFFGNQDKKVIRKIEIQIQIYFNPIISGHYANICETHVCNIMYVPK